jgi:hypothetical protein
MQIHVTLPSPIIEDSNPACARGECRGKKQRSIRVKPAQPVNLIAALLFRQPAAILTVYLSLSHKLSG